MVDHVDAVDCSGYGFCVHFVFVLGLTSDITSMESFAGRAVAILALSDPLNWKDRRVVVVVLAIEEKKKKERINNSIA